MEETRVRGLYSFATICWVIGGVLFGVVGLREGDILFGILGISFFCIAANVFVTRLRTARDGRNGPPRDAPQ